MKEYYDLEYDLTEKEVLDGLRTSGIYKTSGKRAIIESAILAVFCAFFTYMAITRTDGFDIAMAALSFIVICALNIVPRYDMKKQSRVSDKHVKMRVYRDKDKIFVYGKTDPTPIDLSGDNKVVHAKKVEIISIILKSGGILIIPERVIPEEDREDVKSILLKSN